MTRRNGESAVRPLIVKVGSESLDFESFAMEGLVSDLAYVVKNTERRVLVVTSGAVEHGRKALGYQKKRSELTEGEKRRCSSVGQHRLMAGWDSLLAVHGLFSAQMLVTHALVEDSASTALDVISGIRENWNDPRIVSCLNENDPVNSEEIRAMGRGADNDKNAFLIARLV
jgi:glutamate 5-kinase